MQGKDLELYKKVYEGPVIPAHYRLESYKAKPDLARKQVSAVSEFIAARQQKKRQQNLPAMVIKSLVGGLEPFIACQVANKMLSSNNLAPSIGNKI